MNTIFTIGTRGMHNEPFVHILQRHHVDAVIDVRLRNEGRYYKFASSRHIQTVLAVRGIAYAHELLFAPTEEILRAYKATDNWPEYVAAFDNLMEERNVAPLWKTKYAGFHNPCLLCAEETPEKCHRWLLAECFSKNFGLPIVHLVRR